MKTVCAQIAVPNWTCEKQLWFKDVLSLHPERPFELQSVELAETCVSIWQNVANAVTSQVMPLLGECENLLELHVNNNELYTVMLDIWHCLELSIFQFTPRPHPAEKILGSGSYGKVLLCKHNNNYVAVKMILSDTEKLNSDTKTSMIHELFITKYVLHCQRN